MKHCAVAVLLLLAACAAQRTPGAVPPPMAETIPKPPVSPVPLIWQPGHWDWTGSSFVWVPGQYVDRGAGASGDLDAAAFWEKTGVRLGLAAGALDVGVTLDRAAPTCGPGSLAAPSAAVLVPGRVLQGLIDVVDLRDRRWNHCGNMRHSA